MRRLRVFLIFSFFLFILIFSCIRLRVIVINGRREMRRNVMFLFVRYEVFIFMVIFRKVGSIMRSIF